MRFLADESVAGILIRTLRNAGHEVIAVGEVHPSASDEAVAEMAMADRRVLLTEDRDFGWLIFVGRYYPAEGVVYVRYPARARREFSAELQAAIADLGARVRGSFVVVQPGRVRIRRLPGA